MKTIHLYGILAEQFPDGPFEFEVDTIREAASGMECAYPGFREACSDLALHVIAGDLETGQIVPEDELDWTLTAGEIHFVPVAEGDRNPVQAIIGVVMFAIGAYTGNPALMIAGGANVLGSMFAPQTPSFATREPADERPSSLYQGAINTQEEGTPVPYVAGTNVLVGGKIISAALKIEQTTFETDRNGKILAVLQKFITRQ